MQALGLIETRGLIAAIESSDAMLKAADVNLLERTYVGGGFVSIAVTGDIAAVKAAVAAGAAAVRNIDSTLLVSQHVIPRPHGELDNVIVSAVPLKDRGTLTVVPAKNASGKELSVEIIEEHTIVVPVEVEKTIVADSASKELLTEKTANSLKIDLSELHNKEAVDKIVLDYGLEEVIKVLSKFKVVKLRNLARKYKNFGITGRSISRANKTLLIAEFRKYYEHN